MIFTQGVHLYSAEATVEIRLCGVGLDLRRDLISVSAPSVGDNFEVDGIRYVATEIFAFQQDPTHPEIVHPARFAVFVELAEK